MARPPGKRNSTIHLLSGGEKALTAVAMVFAIFELNPSPFCMLDEVDAPLDDANVGRFCDMVQGDVAAGAVHLHHPQQDHHGAVQPAHGRHHARAGRVAAGVGGRGRGGVHRELSSLQELLQSEADEPGRARPVADDDAMPVVEVEPRVTASRTRQEEKVVALYLVAPPQQVFAGADVGAALEEMGLIYSRDMHIYHRYPNGSGGGIPVFGVANLVEPGTLEIDALAATGTPGLTLFLQLPGPMRPLAAFDLFAGTAQRLATRLGGELRDKSRSALSRQTLEHLRDDIQQYELRLRLPSHA
jgi:cell division protein ZipA